MSTLTSIELLVSYTIPTRITVLSQDQSDLFVPTIAPSGNNIMSVLITCRENLQYQRKRTVIYEFFLSYMICCISVAMYICFGAS